MKTRLEYTYIGEDSYFFTRGSSYMLDPSTNIFDADDDGDHHSFSESEILKDFKPTKSDFTTATTKIIAENIAKMTASERQEGDTRDYHVGESNYSDFKIQPWDIWLEYDLNPWDADIIKRTLRTKKGEERIMDYEKIIHVCKERIRQIND